MFFYAFTTFLYVIGNVEYAMSASLMMLLYGYSKWIFININTGR